MPSLLMNKSGLSIAIHFIHMISVFFNGRRPPFYFYLPILMRNTKGKIWWNYGGLPFSSWCQVKTSHLKKTSAATWPSCIHATLVLWKWHFCLLWWLIIWQSSSFYNVKVGSSSGLVLLQSFILNWNFVGLVCIPYLAIWSPPIASHLYAENHSVSKY